MNYEDFCTAEDVATFKRVKHLQMRLARVARQAAVDVLHATHPEATVGEAGKEYVETTRGRYRLSMAGNSDNNTETREHERMHAETVVMGDDDQMLVFFAEHGLDSYALGRFHSLIRRELSTAARPTSIRAMIDGESA